MGRYYGRKPYISSHDDYISFKKATTTAEIRSVAGDFPNIAMKKPYNNKNANYSEMLHYFDSSIQRKEGHISATSPFVIAVVPYVAPSVPVVTPPSVSLWTQKLDYPGSASDRICASVNNKIYVMGGNATYSGKLYEYDPIANTWTSKTPYPGNAVSWQIAAGCNGKIYCGTGLLDDGETVTDEWYEYDPSDDSWTIKTAFGGGGRKQGVAVGTSSKVYVGFGINSAGARTKDWWEYDPTGNSWTEKTSYSGSEISNTSAFCVNDKVYTGMGYGETGDAYHDWWEYDPTGNSWAVKAEFPGINGETDGRYIFAGGVTSTKIYLGTGRGTVPFRYIKDWWEYNPAQNKWNQLEDFPVGPRSGAGSGYANEKIYLGLGDYFYSGTSYSYTDWWEYAPLS